MNPSQYQLPQHVSEDRRRARAAALERERGRFGLKKDAPQPDELRPLPPDCEKLPADVDFKPSKLYGELAAYRLWTTLNLIPGSAKWLVLGRSPSRYLGIFQGILGPRAVMSRWAEDAEFGRQRLCGVNPMQITRLTADEDAPVHEGTPLWEAADAVLRSRKPARTMADVLAAGRLFYTSYSVLWHPRIQEQVQKGSHLAAPTCLFWSDDTDNLMPLAIQLKPPHVTAKNPVFTPLCPTFDWLMARAHAQSADTHTHEGTYHLLETHLISGAIALCMHRRVHPDHPLRQLLDPHYFDNLAINKLALGGLLAPGGTIDTALSGRVAGTLDAARLFYKGWSWKKRCLSAELSSRGVTDRGALPFYHYRDDALEVHAAIVKYASGILDLWYATDEDVVRDTELQAWVAEVASPDGAAIPDFPSPLRTKDELKALCAELIFRAGPQHAAVNNGQFDAYAWVPNAPALLRAPLPDEPSPEKGHFSETDFWRLMPGWSPSTSQINMVWVLSAPTSRTLLHAGDSPAFHPSLCPQAEDVVAAFRRRLRTISQAIQRRNERLDIPYRYLDPLNISRSTDI